MGKIIVFPKTYRSEEFFRFMIKYQDGAEFFGDTLEDAFMSQKNLWEPETSMSEYFEKMRDRLLFITGKLYKFNSIEELVNILRDLNFIEIHDGGENIGSL